MSVKALLIRPLKRCWLYCRIFWKPILGVVLTIVLILAIKIVPFLFMDFTFPPFTVAAQPVKQEMWHIKLPAIGTLQAVQAVTIAPETEGRVTAIHFESGQYVKEGDPILQLNDASEQADLKRYEAQLTYAQNTVNRARKLNKNSFESQADLDQKAANQQQYEAQVLQAKAVINKKNVRAPFEGVLGIREVNVGQYLQPGTAIVSLTNTKKLYVNFTRPESDQAVLQIGQKIEIKVDAYPDKVFEAVISTIEPQVSANTRNIKIQGILNNQGTLNNDDSLLLAPGMFAELKVILDTAEPTLVIPETAVDFSLYGNCVYVIAPGQDKHGQPQTVVKRQYVEVGQHQNGEVAILKGLKAGDMVVISGQLKLQDGMPVVIDEKAKLTPPQTITVH